MKYVSLLLFVVLFASCGEDNKKLTANEIVNNSIKNAGGKDMRMPR
ncbi:hypothetical protein [Christiangramia echinicola]|nr:hypothetical protein [Christiangramia echinicola]